MKVRVEVTAEDIAAGKRGKCDLCPIALALRRTFDAPTYVTAGTLAAGARLAKTPRECNRFMEAFDDGMPVEPFTFEIEVDS